MRNLKRVLSLTLASVMLLGMMVIGSSAAGVKTIDFADADSIEYNEAVDVMVALEVLQGSGKNFNPKDILTREQAAKIICHMLLGAENAEKLTANSDVFKDVAANRWSAGYIAYCAERKILSGVGGGNFAPDGQLTGVAFGKMLLVALGYDPKIQGYTGAGWALAVGADMVDAGIAPSGVLLNAPMTREQAAQAAFQTLTADVVYHAQKGTYIEMGDGKSVLVNASEPVAVAQGSYAKYDTTDSNDATLQFCEKYFPDLKLAGNKYDNNQRPGSTWTYKNAKISFVPKDAALTYISNVKATDAEKDIKSYKLSNPVTPVVDGTSAVSSVSTKTALGTYLNGVTGKGATVTVYVDKNDEITDVVVINTYFGKVTKVAEKDGETTVTISKKTAGAPSVTTFKSTAFEKDDCVVYTVGKDGSDSVIETMALAEAVTGKITATSSNYLRLDGSKYDYNQKIASEDGIAIGDATIYLDGSGYVIYVGKVEGSEAQFLYVKGVEVYMGEVSINAVFADGSSKIVTVDGDTVIVDSSKEIANKGATADGTTNKKLSDYGKGDLTGITGDNKMEGRVFAYTVSGGEYKLSADSTRIQTKDSNTTIDRDKNVVASKVVNTATTFVMIETGKTYTGYREVPSLTAVDLIAVYGKNSTVAEIVFVIKSAEGSNDNAFFFYVANGGAWERTEDEKGTAWYDTKDAYTASDKIDPIDGDHKLVLSETAFQTIDGCAVEGAAHSNHSGNGKIDPCEAGVYKAVKTNDGMHVTSVTVDKLLSAMTTQATTAKNGSLVLDVAAANSKSQYTYDGSTVFVVVEDSGKKFSAIDNVGSEISDIIIKNDSAAIKSDMTYVYVTETKAMNNATTADDFAAKVVYVVKTEKTTGASVNGSGKTGGELSQLIANAEGDEVVLTGVTDTVPTDTVIPSDKKVTLPSTVTSVNGMVVNGTVKITGTQDLSGSTVALQGGTIEMNASAKAPKLAANATGTVQIADKQEASLGSTLTDLFDNTQGYATKVDGSTATANGNTYTIPVTRNPVELTGKGTVAGMDVPSGGSSGTAKSALYALKFPTAVISSGTRDATEAYATLKNGSRRPVTGTRALDGEVVLQLGEDVASVTYKFAEGASGDPAAAIVVFTIGS